jgi:hypothetical protein
MDNLNKYLPVGKVNAKPITIMILGGTSLTGKGWLETAEDTEAHLLSTSPMVAANEWVIAGAAIAGIATPPPAAEAPAGGSP